MERSEILAAMGELKLYGMKAAFDEIIATAIKRQHEPQHFVGDLLTAEITEKQDRSIKYQIAIARACIRACARGRFFNVVELVNKLEAETRAGRQGRMAEYLARKNFIIL